MTTKYEIFKHWEDWLVENKGIHEGSYCCFACGDFIHVHISEEYDKPEISPKKKWNNLRNIEKHHIHARQFGGKNTLDNMFLLCHECHEKAPLVSIFDKDKELFLRWAKAQSYTKRLNHELKEILEWIFESEMEKQNFMDWMDNFATKYHRNPLSVALELNYEVGLHHGFRGTKVPFSSYMILFYHVWKTNPRIIEDYMNKNKLTKYLFNKVR